MANLTNKFDCNKVFFTSDCHFDHANIIKYCSRPFESADEMNRQLILNWNKVVQWDDTVFILGDFCFGQKTRWEKILPQLNGYKYLVLGNHDKLKYIPENGFEAVERQMMITITGDEECNNQQLFMSHYPMITWDGSHRGSWQLYGHTHQNDKIDFIEGLTDKLSPTQLNVGVDNNNYYPFSFQEIKKRITKQILAGKYLVKY